MYLCLSTLLAAWSLLSLRHFLDWQYPRLIYQIYLSIVATRINKPEDQLLEVLDWSCLGNTGVNNGSDMDVGFAKNLFSLLYLL